MKRIIIFSIFASSILTSCAPALYSPNAQVTPLPEKKGEIDATGSYGLSGYSATANYAITDHIAVGVQGRVAKLSKETGSKLPGAPDKNNAAGANLTWYNTVKSNPSLRWGITGGANIGRSADYYVTPGAESAYEKADYKQFFVQPSYGFVSENFEAIASCNFSKVTLTHVDNDLSELPQYNTYHFQQATPALTFRGGSKTIKGFVQSGYTLTNNPRTYRTVSSWWGGRMNMTAGVQIRLGRR